MNPEAKFKRIKGLRRERLLASISSEACTPYAESERMRSPAQGMRCVLHPATQQPSAHQVVHMRAARQRMHWH